ncbi:MAG: DUF309 domain-containing protein [Chthoniobacterales bacterium]
MSKGERISQFVQKLEPEAAASHSSDVADSPFYRGFFRCWNEQRYYEAHDVLEDLWLRTTSEDARFFKGLIQAAGAFVHLQKQFEHPEHVKHGRRLAPAVRLFRLASKNLEPFGNVRHRLDLVRLRQLLEETAGAILASNYKTNPWSPDGAPTLSLLH